MPKLLQHTLEILLLRSFSQSSPLSFSKPAWQSLSKLMSMSYQFMSFIIFWFTMQLYLFLFDPSTNVISHDQNLYHHYFILIDDVIFILHYLGEQSCNFYRVRLTISLPMLLLVCELFLFMWILGSIWYFMTQFCYL